MRILFSVVAFSGCLASLQAQPAQEPERQEAVELAAIERRVQAVYERTAPAVVRIAYGKDPEQPLGSGGIVTPHGHVVTTSGATRTVRQDDLLALHLPDGRCMTGTALGWSEEWQVGVMKITGQGPWPHVPLGDTGDLKAGQLCVALGYPLFFGVEFDRWPTVDLGAVTRSAAPHWLTSSCNLKSHGSSVFDLEGRLVGVTACLPVGDDPVHVGIEVLKTHWDDLVAGNNLDRVRLLSSEGAKGEALERLDQTSEATGEEQSAQAATNRAKAASVRLRGGGEVRSWSGTVVTPDGYIATCAHPGQLPGGKVAISFPDGREVAGVVLGANRVSDVGLAKITDEGPWPYVELGQSTILRLGDRCLAIGYPAHRQDGQPQVRKTQIVESKDGSWSCLLWTSAYPSRGGESGGGIFDPDGRLVAVFLGFEQGPAWRQSKGMKHARVEMLRKQWDLLAAGKPVEVLKSEPLAEITAALRRIVGDLPPIAVEVFSDGKQRALGTIVRSDGRILAKASELSGAISCRLADGRVLPATVAKVSREHDLAILKINAANLPEASWSKEEDLSPGTLIAALVPGKPPLTGVVSLAPRPVPPVTGWLGVGVQDSDRGLEVVHDGNAQEYGVPLCQGDVVVHVEGRPTPDLKTCRELLEPEVGAAIAYASDPVRVGVKRGDDTLEFRFPLPLSYSIEYFGAEHESLRWSGFPSVFGTNIPLTPKLCGGPMIDKTGRVIGVAIACRTVPFTSWGQRHVIPAAVAKCAIAEP